MHTLWGNKRSSSKRPSSSQRLFGSLIFHLKNSVECSILFPKIPHVCFSSNVLNYLSSNKIGILKMSGFSCGTLWADAHPRVISRKEHREKTSGRTELFCKVQMTLRFYEADLSTSPCV